MDCRCAVCFLLLANLISAAPLKLDGELHYNSLEVTLHNREDSEVFFDLGFQLKKKTEDWRLVDRLDCGGNSSVPGLGSRVFNCSYTAPGEPGSYKIYARADIVNGTYAYKDFFFDVGQNGFEEAEPESDVVLEFLSVPEEVRTGEEFSVIVNVTARRDVSMEIYSYVYGSKTCHSFYGWKGNAQKHAFKKGEHSTINLSDSVDHDTANGTYSLKVRARGDKDWDIMCEIRVIQTSPDLGSEVPSADEPMDVTGWVVFLIALVPLAILAIARLL